MFKYGAIKRVFYDAIAFGATLFGKPELEPQPKREHAKYANARYAIGAKSS